MTLKSETAENKHVVLLVEDDLFLTKIYQTKLQSENIDVYVAEDGRQALELVEKGLPPDLVVLDLMLPYASGYDVLEAIRKNQKWAKIPVIVFSNLCQTEDVRRAKEIGISDFTVKCNITTEEMIQKIKKQLKQPK